MPQRRSPIAPERGHVAADALTAAQSELRDQVPPGHRRASWLYAHRILERDDEHGASRGLVVQADAVPWNTLDSLLDLATYGALLHARLAHYPNRAAPGCELCGDADRLWHTALTDPIIEHRQAGTATERYEAIRSLAAGDLDRRPFSQPA
ncbi:MAG: hypothetical protein ACR2N4_16085 [Jatrophihabitans sp.]